MSTEDGAVLPGEDAVPQVDNQNVAAEGAHVDQQIGVQIGDTTIHHDSRTYHINQGDPPERRHEVARNLLSGGTPRRAEEVFATLLRQGHITTERTYYYTLSVISERSLTELSGELLDCIKDAYKMCLSFPTDAWSKAFTAVWELLCWVRREYSGTPGGDRTEVLAALRVLPFTRQEEIVRHMDVILRGLTQEWWEADLKRHMMRERIAPERAKQSWKFFEAAPAEPKPYPPDLLSPGPGDRSRTIFGIVGVLIGLAALVTGPFRLGLLPELLLMFTGATLVFRYGVVIESAKVRHGTSGHDLMQQREEGEGNPAGDLHSMTAFGKTIGSLVDRLFKEHGSATGASAEQQGEAPHRTYRTYLKKRLVRSYLPGEVKTANLRWLVEWHAKRAQIRGDGHEAANRTGLAVNSGTVMCCGLGVLVALAGLIDALSARDLLPVTILSFSGWFAVRHGVRLAATRRANLAAWAEADALYDEEMDAYRARLAELADRPTDAQIARWHALDKFYLVSDVIKRVGLKRDQVIEYVVLTECAPFARRGRLEYGPPRYSAYRVRILLLTQKGVREVSLHLDAHTGEAKNEERFMFRYDAVVSAKVTEKGVRTTGVNALQDSDVENLRSREFRLVLSNGEAIKMKVNSFKSWQHQDESDSELIDAAYETSGIETALPILEAIAAEGEGWIAHEQDRRKQWSREWDEVAVAG
ncbi:hypothetical protein [Goodfellowiella coeruleoviolacea]|uniref:Uncharacterized protein n=1 Tax=Goodfellowiella coeruleoviolacea TaxID=334858 RepID=A0AAE3GG80_9PSEU|nr:hypothetical protein [Goodfellowiella coeruleoviolacea]MCP2167118.1 hypothetical protein [Goodfellowiella coeruleoviolacea]